MIISVFLFRSFDTFLDCYCCCCSYINPNYGIKQTEYIILGMKCNCEFCSCIFYIIVAVVGDTIHVGLSDSEYTYANETMQNEITTCQMWKTPVSVDIDITVGCSSTEPYGQYLYISLIRESVDNGYIELYEVGVYMMGEYFNWIIVNTNLRNKPQWNLQQNSYIFIREMHLKMPSAKWW